MTKPAPHHVGELLFQVSIIDGGIATLLTYRIVDEEGTLQDAFGEGTAYRYCREISGDGELLEYVHIWEGDHPEYGDRDESLFLGELSGGEFWTFDRQNADLVMSIVGPVWTDGFNTAKERLLRSISSLF